MTHYKIDIFLQLSIVNIDEFVKSRIHQVFSVLCLVFREK